MTAYIIVHVYRQSPIFSILNQKIFLVSDYKYGNFLSLFDTLSPFGHILH